MNGEFGYAGKILRVDLSSARISEVPTAGYADKFIGGRGMAAKIFWDEVPPEVSALDEKNQLIFITGPLAGLPGMAGSRWEICGRSPATDVEHFTYSNLGGRWGTELKYAGYDGIVVQGKSEKPIYLLIEGGSAELRDASALWGKYSVEVRSLLKEELGKTVRVAAVGPAGENLVSAATVLADEDASGSGFGAVMGSKKLKAIVVRGGSGRLMVAHPEKLRELTKYAYELKPDGARHIFRWMQLPPPADDIKKQHCFGCISGCNRANYEAADGDRGKFICQASAFYKRRALSYYGERNEVPFYATRLCDKYGLDTKVIEPIIAWLTKCYSAGILSDEKTGIPISKIGSREFIETLLKKIALREGFGDVLAQGIYQAADYVGNGSKEMIVGLVEKGGQGGGYNPRAYITNGIFYAMEPKRPITQLHAISRSVEKWKNWLEGLEGAYMSGEVIRAVARRFWGSELAADFSTYEAKALAAKMIQEREYAISCLILCNQLWPMMDVENTADHIGDPALESKLYSAVTGNEVDEAGLNRIGERVFNLLRAILVREGDKGREDDRLADYNYTIPIGGENLNPNCLVPGKDGEPLAKKGSVVDREKFVRMLEEYYQLRSWDVGTGLQTRAKLGELGLEDVAQDLAGRGLIV